MESFAEFEDTITELVGEGTSAENYMALARHIRSVYGDSVAENFHNAVDATDGEFYLRPWALTQMFEQFAYAGCVPI